MNLSLSSALLAQAGQTQQNPTAGMLNLVLMMAAVGIFLFWSMRSQSKKTKEHNAKLATIKAGDKVVTTGGIVGTVVAVKDKTLSMRSADTKLEILKSAISDITERGGEAAAAE